MDQEIIDTIIEKRRNTPGHIMALLEDIQQHYGYLPEDVLRAVAERTHTSLVDIYGVATFYKAFSLRPRGKHLVSVCMGTACHVRGAPAVEARARGILGVKPGETTDDEEFTYETVNCLGACALGPIVVTDGKYHSMVKPGDVGGIIDTARNGEHGVGQGTDVRVFPLKVNCPRCNHSLMDEDHLIDGHPAVRLTFSVNQQHGWLRLSSLYGSLDHETEYPIPDSTVVHFFCPHCHTPINGSGSCPECSAPVVPLMVRPGGTVQICSRRGCAYHRLDLP